MFGLPMSVWVSMLSLSSGFDFISRRGLPMALFSAAAVGGTGVGPIFAGWIEMNPRLDWRWIQWVQLM